MISSCSKVLLLLGSLLISSNIWAQELDPVLWQPTLTLNYKLNYNWSLNFSTSYRSTILEDYGSPIQLSSEHLQFSHNTSYAVGFYGKVSAGIMYRFNTIDERSNENELRLTQQYSHAKRYNALRVVHRIKADQRIQSSNEIYRFRYRFSVDFPLSGLKVDPKEFYLIIAAEALSSIAVNTKPKWDQRVTGNIGFQWSNPVKVQLGLEYRWEDYSNQGIRRTFLYTSLFYSL